MKVLVPAFLALMLAPTAGAAPAPPRNRGCAGGRLALGIRYAVEHDVDTGLRGNNWAFDSYVRSVRVWRKNGNRFCAASAYDGTFTSIAGPSPSGRHTIPDGIQGTFKGSSVVIFRGTALQGVRAGDLGLKNFACTSADAKGRCAGTYNWLSSFFTGVKDFRYVRYAFAYHATAGGTGTWSDALVDGKVRTHGDITARGKGK